jgi:hypothetical protein
MTSVIRAFYVLAIVTAVSVAPTQVHAQRMTGLRSGVPAAAPVAPTVFPMLETTVAAPHASDGVSRRSLAIGAGVGALVGGITGGAIVNNSDFGKNEAWPLFVGGGALIGALIGAGLGMTVAAFILP